MGGFYDSLSLILMARGVCAHNVGPVGQRGFGFIMYTYGPILSSPGIKWRGARSTNFDSMLFSIPMRTHPFFINNRGRGQNQEIIILVVEVSIHA